MLPKLHQQHLRNPHWPQRQNRWPYLDRDGKDMLHDGGTLFLESKPPFYGPGRAGIINVAGQDWFSCHYYDGSPIAAARFGSVNSVGAMLAGRFHRH